MAVDVVQRALAHPARCVDRFEPHPLSVATGLRMREIRTYASNGAGVAANDLEGDGDIDLVTGGGADHDGDLGQVGRHGQQDETPESRA